MTTAGPASAVDDTQQRTDWKADPHAQHHRAVGLRLPLEPSTIRVFHDTQHPSQLVLGLLQRGGIESGYPQCGTSLSQPCRANPRPVPEGQGPDGGTAEPQQLPPPCTARRKVTVKIPRARRAQVRSLKVYVDGKLKRRIRVRAGRKAPRKVRLPCALADRTGFASGLSSRPKNRPPASGGPTGSASDA